MILVTKQFHVLSVSNSQSSHASKSPGEVSPASFPESWALVNWSGARPRPPCLQMLPDESHRQRGWEPLFRAAYKQWKRVHPLMEAIVVPWEKLGCGGENRPPPLHTVVYMSTAGTTNKTWGKSTWSELFTDKSFQVPSQPWKRGQCEARYTYGNKQVAPQMLT